MCACAACCERASRAQASTFRSLDEGGCGPSQVLGRSSHAARVPVCRPPLNRPARQLRPVPCSSRRCTDVAASRGWNGRRIAEAERALAEILLERQREAVELITYVYQQYRYDASSCAPLAAAGASLVVLGSQRLQVPSQGLGNIQRHASEGVQDPGVGTTDCNTRARAATFHLRPVHGDTALLNPHATQRVQSGPQHESQRATAHDDPIFHERYVCVCARASPCWRQLTCPVHSLDDAVLQSNE